MSICRATGYEDDQDRERCEEERLRETRWIVAERHLRAYLRLHGAVFTVRIGGMLIADILQGRVWGCTTGLANILDGFTPAECLRLLAGALESEA